jgi:putative RNA 2'-phosphotransferase
LKDHIITKLDKILTAVLDKIPDTFGVVLDENGCLKIKDLYFALQDESGIGPVTPNFLERTINQFLSDKYEILDKKIRLKPGLRTNFIEMDDGIIPPEILYLCIRRRAYDHVEKFGLETNGDEMPFILTTDMEIALKLGKKKDNDPVLIEIFADDAANKGIEFFKYGSLYLSYYIPHRFLGLPPKKEEKVVVHEKTKPDKTTKEYLKQPEGARPPAYTGSYYMSLKDMLPHLFDTSSDKKQKGKKGKDKEPVWKEARREREKKWDD